ncbi:MAG: response regulator [Candidatus Eisenbacteria bacterium]|nr:response regulator [Candidatus Eisenbacteria bacterium]
MNAPGPGTRRAADPAEGEIARGLVEALRRALEPDAPARARAVARGIAQVLGLEGLDQALHELGREVVGERPTDLAHVEARLTRLADEAEAAQSTQPLLAAETELQALARALRDTEWAGEGADAVPVYAVADVLTGLPLEPDADLGRARVTAPVAASLRAALDWIGADEALVLQAGFHDSALALTCPVAHEGGLAPAGAVLATVEGSLGPESDGRWTLRVPLHVERPSFLLVRIGHVPAAIPWHSVARLRMHSPAEWSAAPEPVLAPLATPSGGEDERPGALVALGLTRAWLVADRIVWRIAAHAEPAEERGPFGAATRAVRVESGELYWVLEPAWLLRTTVPIAVAPPAPRPRPGVVSAPGPEVQMAAAQAAALANAPRVRAGAPPAGGAAGEAHSLADAVARAIDLLRGEREAAAASAPPPRVVEPSLTVLRPEDVTPLDGSPEPGSDVVATADPTNDAPAPGTVNAESPASVAERPGAAAAPANTTEEPSAAAAPSPDGGELPPAAPVAASPAAGDVAASASAAPAAGVVAAAPAGDAESERPSRRMSMPGRRALVADDSLVARIFLARLLERRGFFVELVGDGESMWHALSRGPWSLVCADATMPDSHGRGHVERLLDFRGACREPFRLILLTRDAGEEREAASAGATLCLRKPFDAETLDDLLSR